MMMAKPVIINEETLISKKITDWDIGYVCGYNDYYDLRTLLKTIYLRKSELLIKGNKAYKLHIKEFNWENYEQKFWRILEKV